ncbi:MAG TPA: ArgE/DapE family deacylase [Chloroflexi bacterium]|nr:ArgE/DapE family deacylase [Chloroflexota bacterium]
MVRIDSVNPSLVPGAAGEGRMAEWLSRACESLGLEVRTQETAEGRPNVIARWPGRGGGRSLLLTGHTDIVGTEGMTIEPFEPRIEDGRMYGRGTMDMKGGLAAILGAVAALRAGGFEPAGDLLLGFVTDEEYVSIGSEALVKTVRADAAILTEPTGLEIVIAHRGYAWLSLETRGRAAHGSLYDVGIDAIAHMGRVLNTLERMEQEVLPRRKHPLLGRPSVHTSAIEGGLSWAIYPDRCTLKIEHRTLPGETGEDVLALWENALAELSSADPTFSATARLEFFRPAYEIERDEPIAAVLGEAFRAATRKEPVYSGMRAWLDSAILGPAGIPTVIFGPGGEGMHAAVEYVYLEDVFRCAAVLAGAAALWTGTAT